MLILTIRLIIIMNENAANWLNYTTKELEKEIYSFLTAKNKPCLLLPKPLQRQSQLRVIIAIKYVLPLVGQTDIEAKPKGLILKMLVQLLANSKLSIESVEQFFNRQKSGQLEYQIENETTLLNILTKMISLPTHISNMMGDLTICNTSFSLKEIQANKTELFQNILETSARLPIEERLIIVNKLLVLKEEQVVVNHLVERSKQFFIDNFSNLSKQNNIIKHLYRKYLSSVSQKEGIKEILTTLANSATNITSSLVSLLSLNQPFYYAGNKYQEFYNVFYHTKQKGQIIRQLLLWWAVSKNFIVTSTQAKARCNVLAMITENIPKEELYLNNYLVSLTQGIKKKLTDGSSKDFAILIWKMIGKKLEIKLTDEIEKADYFVIEEENHIVEHAQERENITLKDFNQKKPQQMAIPQSEKPKQDSQQETKQEQQDDVIRIEPKNIYDCILCLRNPHRKDVAIKKLPQIIKRYKEDLVLMWNMLLRELLSPVKEEYTAVLVELFALKPQDFIESVVMFFMSRENNITEKTNLIEVLKQGIDELSSTQQEEDQRDDQTFYFKKVKSKYFKQAQGNVKSLLEVQQKQSRTRRWGHTRIAHEKSAKGIHIDFLKKQISANRFYPIANLLYFKIIDVMCLNLIENLRSHQVYVHSLLKLIAVFISNIKNHFDKYIVISDASNLCLKIIRELIQNSKRTNDRYEETGGMTLMLTLQILNKISLVIDHYAPENIMETLKQTMEGSRKLPNNGMGSVIHMIEGNIYQRVYRQATQ